MRKRKRWDGDDCRSVVVVVGLVVHDHLQQYVVPATHRMEFQEQQQEALAVLLSIRWA